MPDGSEYRTWENATVWSKTYVVDQNHHAASDDNPGTAGRPFLTIGKAAQVLEPGERVVVESGTYREEIVPRKGGTGPGRMIGYEAAPGARVLIKGSRSLRREWSLSKYPSECSQKLWMITLAADYFEKENPFALENANAADLAIMPWATEWTGKYPFTMRRGMVFQNGKRMVQLAEHADLRWLPGSFWVDPSGTVIHARPFDDADPNTVEMEITVQQHLVNPAVPDLGYVRVAGFRFMHAGNGYPRTGVGALFTRGGHHWLIENNTVSGINSVGIEIGTRTLESADRELSRKDAERARENPGFTVVRSNRIFDCGRGGVQGFQVRRALVEANHIHDCGWWDVEKLWETAGIKLLCTENCLVRRNRIERITASPAVWLDWNNRFSRVTANLIVDCESCNNGAVFVEASRKPCWVDHNVFWDIKGAGVCAGDTDNLLVAHNLVGPCTQTGVRARVLTDRTLDGRAMTARDNRIVNNIFITGHPIELSDMPNVSDCNVFADPEFDLARWQQDGHDTHGLRLALAAAYSRDSGELSLTADTMLPLLEPAVRNDADYYGALPDTDTVPPGPFLHRLAKPVVLKATPLRA
jgi:hypothetical protein